MSELFLISDIVIERALITLRRPPYVACFSELIKDLHGAVTGIPIEVGDVDYDDTAPLKTVLKANGFEALVPVSRELFEGGFNKDGEGFLGLSTYLGLLDKRHHLDPRTQQKSVAARLKMVGWAAFVPSNAPLVMNYLWGKERIVFGKMAAVTKEFALARKLLGEEVTSMEDMIG